MTVVPELIVLNVENARRAAEFWTRALGYEQEAEAPDFLVPPHGKGVRIHLDERDRTHLDLWVDRTTSDLNIEVERLISLGAKRAWSGPIPRMRTSSSWPIPRETSSA
jgi:hypothetical protein